MTVSVAGAYLKSLMAMVAAPELPEPAVLESGCGVVADAAAVAPAPEDEPQPLTPLEAVQRRHQGGVVHHRVKLLQRIDGVTIRRRDLEDASSSELPRRGLRG